MIRNSIGVALSAFICGVLASAPVHATSAYFIGNSLTNDMQPFGLAAIAASDGKSLTVGHHILAGNSLDYISTHPTEITPLTPASPSGTFNNALPNNSWDVVTFQPYDSATSTLGTDISAIESFIDLERSGPSTATHFYIYEGWAPSYTFVTSNYQHYWEKVIPDNLSQPTSRQRGYTELLDDHLSQHYGNQVAIDIIPIGEVFNELDKRIRAGTFQDFANITDVYRDTIHLSEVGRYIAAMTVFATIFNEDPTGLGIPAGFYNQGGAPIRLTDPLALKLQHVVWDVVSNYPRSGVTAPEPVLQPVPLPNSLPMFALALGLGYTVLRTGNQIAGKRLNRTA
jgi:hypothetical protein